MKAFCLAWSLFALSAGAAQFKFATQTFTVPDGFMVELAAGPPLVQRPVSASFDWQGRLYVTDSSGSNDKPDKQLQEKPHRVLRLEDTDGDGRFDKSTVFADKMMFPEGCLWYDGSVYVAAPPSIWKLTDTDGDGVADKREEWFQGKTLTGCANDLHGPYLGPDGWIYWCKGAFAKQTYERPGKPPFVTRAAHIFRARPDGTGIEPVLTGGMDNPVGVAFTAEGERILCGTFFEPHIPGHRDGLIHAIYGGVYGKVNDVTDPFPKTGDLMPVMTHMGPAAPCSVIRYESSVFGEEYRDNLFVCQFNMHKVSRHVLVPEGATFKTQDSNFMVSDNPDFHPTDVIEDADGSLLVVDTGGWYKLCCPTSQLAKPDVLGAIYRVRRIGAKKLEDARGLKIGWSEIGPRELTALLSDERPIVWRRALFELGRLGQAAVADLRAIVASGREGKFDWKHAGNKYEAIRQHERWWAEQVAKLPFRTTARQSALWALTRIDSEEARAAVRAGLEDFELPVRLVAYQSVSLHRDKNAGEQIHKRFNEGWAPREWRAAFESIGRTGSFINELGLLLKATYDNDTFPMEKDRVLMHSLTYALIESNARTAARSLARCQDNFGPAGLIALDQMEGGGLKAEEVVRYLNSPAAEMKTAALWVAGRHTEWGGELMDYFRERLAAWAVNPVELGSELAQFSVAPEIQDLIANSLKSPKAAIEKRRILLHAIADARLKSVPAGWVGAVNRCLEETSPEILLSAVAAAKVLSQVKTNPPNFSEPLLRIALMDSSPADVRLAALAALPDGLASVSPQLFKFLFASLDSAKPVVSRGQAADVLARAKLSDEQLLALAEATRTASPLDVPKLLTAFEHSTNEAVGLKLITALRDSKALASLRPDLLMTVAARYPASVQEKANELLVLLNVDTAKQTAHLEELLAACKGGDIRRGQLIFNSQKASCFACHKMGYMGGEVGPDLTSIGQARTERDLLESIVYPSASFVRSYEPVIVHTKSDEEYSGVVRRDAADEIVLATGVNAEMRIARADIVEMRPGTVSVMPAGLDEQLTRQELADLLAFLKATKWGPQ